MEIKHIPRDLKAEILLSYLPADGRRISVCGPHKRNAYEDILEIDTESEPRAEISIARKGLYDILPECLFHPVDRFSNLPANEYSERFREEYEQQQAEEADARRFFAPYDVFLLELSSLIARIKDNYSDNSVISDIIFKDASAEYASNRFVARTRRFLSQCRIIRGNRPLLTLMLRKILSEEGLRLEKATEACYRTDREPRYKWTLDENEEEPVYLGNEFEENITVYNIHYWNDDECKSEFLNFVAEIETFERFINDYFVSVESEVKFILCEERQTVRLSDEMVMNYLGFNTNL